MGTLPVLLSRRKRTAWEAILLLFNRLLDQQFVLDQPPIAGSISVSQQELVRVEQGMLEIVQARRAVVHTGQVGADQS